MMAPYSRLAAWGAVNGGAASDLQVKFGPQAKAS